MKKIYVVAFLSFLTLTTNAQVAFEWAKSMGGTELDNGRSITTDANGNVYTTGFFEGTVDFDPGVGTFNLTSIGFNDDAFISKLDPSGNFLWAKRLGGALDVNSLAIVLDNLGNVYTTGHFEGVVDFDPGTGVFNLTSNGNSDIFLHKLDTAGNFVWVKQMGGILYDYSSSLTIDSAGDLIITGSFSGTTDFDPGAGIVNLTSIDYNDVYICKINTAGNFIWAKQFVGASYGYGNSITQDGSDNIYMTGSFNGTTDFDPGTAVFNLTPVGDVDIFICKLDASGNFIWAKRQGGFSRESSSSITIDVFGNVYTTGQFLNTTDFDPGSGIFNLSSSGATDGYISKLDSSGNFVWAKKLGGSANDAVTYIATDAIGNVYSTGAFNGAVDFDPGPTTHYLYSVSGSSDSFTYKLDPSGNFIWVKQIGGTYNNYGSAIVFDAFNNLYTFGVFGHTVDFDPGIGTFNITSNGIFDVFIQKLSVPGIGTDTQVACGSYTWLDGITYTTNNNTATFNIVGGAANMSDSLVILNLTINNSTTGTDTLIACDSLVWMDGVNYTASNYTATHTITNINGCDSVVSLNLTINNSSTVIDTQVACNAYTWINGFTYTTSNNTAIQYLTNAFGCDSIISLNLTINTPTNGIDVATTCGTYFWIDGNVYTSNNTTATHTIVNGNANGCDSIVTLNLTVGSASSGTDIVSACGTYVWIDGNAYTTDNNTAFYTLPNGNANGCDSLVTLNLTMNVNTVDTTITQSNDSIWANATSATYQWLDCNNNNALIVGATNALFVAVANGYYAVQVTQYGCVDTSACVQVITIGIEENRFKNELLLYPNPTNGNFEIDLGKNYLTTTVTITDVIGKQVQTTTFSNKQKLKFKLENPAGVYFLTVKTPNNTAVIRLIKK